MVHEVKFFHCNETDEVIETESYLEENGAIISVKVTEPGQNEPFLALRPQLEREGWEIALAGVTRLGPQHVPANSYYARRLRP